MTEKTVHQDYLKEAPYKTIQISFVFHIHILFLTISIFYFLMLSNLFALAYTLDIFFFSLLALN